MRITIILILLFISGCDKNAITIAKNKQACADHGGVFDYRRISAWCNDGYHIRLPKTLNKPYWVKTQHD